MKTKLLVTILSGFAGLTANAQCSIVACCNSTICYGQSTAVLNAFMNGTQPCTYLWAPSTGLSCTSCVNPTANPPFSNTYTVTGTDANNCTNTATVSITVGSIPFVSAIAPTTICGGDSAQLNANASNGTMPYSYYWSPPNDLNNPNLQNPTSGAANTTPYTVTVTDANGCTDDSTTIVSVETVPQVSFGPFSINGNTVTYSANVSSNGQSCLWEFGDGMNVVTYAPNTDPGPHTYAWGGSYTVCVTVFNTMCSAEICTTITILGIEDYYLSQFVNISPNPTTGIFTLDAGGQMQDAKQITIYNVYGEKVYSASVISRQSSVIDLSSQPSGIYFVQLKTEKGIIAKKIILQR